MEGEPKKAGWKIWLYLTPVYVILAIPLILWMKKINSSDVDLSKDEYNAFNAESGNVKTRSAEDYNPGLTDSGYNVRYRSDGETGEELGVGGSIGSSGQKGSGPGYSGGQAPGAGGQGSGQAGDGRSTGGQGGNYSLPPNEAQVKAQTGMGYQKGYLTTAVSKVLGSPAAVKALLNNKYIVNGFMSRATVKAATGSPEGLANFLKGPGPSNFINNPVVKAALNNPAIVSAVASSGLIGAMMDTPAAKALMNDPDKLADIVNSNPQLMQLAMQNPQTLTMLMGNKDVSGLIGRFDTSKVKTTPF
ncbi:MAG: hypothetical protein M0025_01130 [Elusimicrobia bacterium]|nr:hypothetical protein [Elusimicrobiota bacterium]